MQRFIRPSASSSSGDAAQPASIAATSISDSAERPAASKQLSLTTLHGVKRWLDEDHVASCNRPDAERIKEAVVVLSRSKPRQADLEPLQPKWQVARKHEKKRRPQADVIQELQGKVIKAAQELQQQLAASAEKPDLGASSNDRADVQNDPAADQDAAPSALEA